MADSQHTAEETENRDGLALAVSTPEDLGGGEWTVWIGPLGSDPRGSEDGTLIGFGPTRESAVDMAKRRIAKVLATLRERYSA